MKSKLVTMLLALAAVVMFSATAKADPVTFTFTTPSLTATPNTVVNFFATLTNTGLDSPTSIAINGASFNLPFAGFSLDDTPFLLNFDGQSIASGASLGPLSIFNVAVGNVAPGSYTGSFTVFYQSVTGGLQSVSQNFQIVVQSGTDPIPEPATLILLGTGLAGAAAAARRRRRREAGGGDLVTPPNTP
ncbi:MAG: PEP-CTERM sorting domain-containing protein [Rubrivivax sp.]|nr:PEP-CTERM sorting domain-containing protein [Pyrinomonadaceae bacterium]